MDDYNFKFRVVKNIGAGSKKTFGKVGTVIEVKDGKFTDNLGTEYGYLSKWDFESLKTYLEKSLFFEGISTEIELVEESEELTPIEFLKLCNEISKILLSRGFMVSK